MASAPPSLGGVDQRADSWEDFDLWGRCITKGLIGSMLPGNLYNKGNQILQAPGYVVIRNEMVHETRVIPLDGRPHVGSGVRTYMGDGVATGKAARWWSTPLISRRASG